MSDWLEAAKALPLGQKTRIPCCKSDATLLVSHSSRGYSAWCFRCHHKEWQAHGERKISDIVRHKAERQIIQQQEIALPEDYTLDVPMAKAVWYMQAGISPEVAQAYRIGYSPKLDRVVMPVYEQEELVAVQMRACTETQKPKYLNITGGKSAAMFWSRPEIPGLVGVVTEDILSAIKIGRVFPSASILGSHINDARTMKLVRKWKEVILWLDPDKAGQEGMKDAANRLLMQGVTVSVILSEKDPKLHTLDEIRDYIGEAILD